MQIAEDTPKLGSNMAGIRTPAEKYLLCLVSGKQKEPQKGKKTKRGASSGEELRVRQRLDFEIIFRIISLP